MGFREQHDNISIAQSCGRIQSGDIKYQISNIIPLKQARAEGSVHRRPALSMAGTWRIACIQLLSAFTIRCLCSPAHVELVGQVIADVSIPDALMDGSWRTGNVHDISVGGDDPSVFVPSYVQAALGDTVRFNFTSSKHAVTESTLSEPCKDRGTFDTGYVSYSAGNNASSVSLIVDSTISRWFFSKQNGTSSPCSPNSLFAINPGDLWQQFCHKAGDDVNDADDDSGDSSLGDVLPSGQSVKNGSSAFQLTASSSVNHGGSTSGGSTSASPSNVPPDPSPQLAETAATASTPPSDQDYESELPHFSLDLPSRVLSLAADLIGTQRGSPPVTSTRTTQVTKTRFLQTRYSTITLQPSLSVLAYVETMG